MTAPTNPHIYSNYQIVFRDNTGTARQWSGADTFREAKIEQLSCYAYLNQRSLVWVTSASGAFYIGPILYPAA